MKNTLIRAKDYLSPSDIAKDLGVATRTVQRYCSEGFLKAELIYRNDKAYFMVRPEDYAKWKRAHFAGIRSNGTSLSKHTSKCKGLSKNEIRKEWVPVWLEWLEMGKLGNKPVGQRTREIYEYYFGMYLGLLPPRPSQPIISVDNFRKVLGEIAVKNFATRRHVYEAVMSITKYLVEVGKFEKEDRETVRKLRPRRVLPPHRPCLTEKQYEKLLAKTQDFKHGSRPYDRLVNKTLLVFMANTGLRASEVGNLRLKDVDLESRIVYVWLGKMNKNRRVGITNECLEALRAYLPRRLKEFGTKDDHFFLNSVGTHFDRSCLGRKFNRLSHGMDFLLSPHMLRRYFVTSNVARGRQLVYLQIMAGHADITTTRSYCQTSEDEVLGAMKNW